MKNCVYFFKNYDEEIIYIGKAKDLEQRMFSHNHLDIWCYMNISYIDYIEFETEFDTETMEKLWIAKYKPKFNKVYSNKDTGINIDIEHFEVKRFFDVNLYLDADKETIKYCEFIIKKIKNEFKKCNFDTEWNLVSSFLFPKYRRNYELLDMTYFYNPKNIEKYPVEAYIREEDRLLKEAFEVFEYNIKKHGYIDDCLIDDIVDYRVIENEVFEHFNEETNEYEYPTRKRLKWRYSLGINNSFNIDIEDYLYDESLIEASKEFFKERLMKLISDKYDLSKRAIIPVLKEKKIS